MQPQTRFQVFISSTYTDLIDERQAAMRAILELGHFPAGMEQFSAGNSDAWSLIERVIEESDFYLLIVGGRYGSTDVRGLSFTEREYNHAVSLGKPVIPLLHKDPASLPRKRTDANDIAWEKLTAFAQHIREKHTCSFWDSASELRACSMAGLLAATQRAAGGGWVRADTVSAVPLVTASEVHRTPRRRTVSVQDAMLKNVEAIDQLYTQDLPEGVMRTEGFSTGLRDLDLMIGGLRPSELVTVAARPSVGKTTLALSLLSVVAKLGLPTLIFSLKHSSEDVSKRLLTLHGGLNATRVFSGNLYDDEWPKLTHSIQVLNAMNLEIADSPLTSLSQLEETCREAKTRFGSLALVLIDSMHYLESQLGESISVGAALKRLAREIGAAFLVTCNVGAEAEIRPNRRPVLRDMSATTGLADESDIVIFLYDDSIYHYESPDRGTVELILAKNVLGPLGTVRVRQLGPYHGYEDFAVHMG
jgi:KaiC/GvpD/RAD55 family RecA-like ATPase